MPMLTKKQIEEALERGVKPEQIKNYMRTGSAAAVSGERDVDLLADMQTKQKESESETLLGKAKRYGKTGADILGITTAFEFGKMPTQAVGTALAIPEQKKTAEARGRLADVTTALIKRLKTMSEGDRKEKMKGIIKDNFKQMGMTKEAEQALEEEMLPTGIEGAKHVAGKTLEAGMTAAIVKAPKATMGGKLWQRSLKGAGFGAGFYSARQLKEGEKITPGGLAVSAGIGGAVPVVFAAGAAVIRFVGSALKRAGSVVTGKGKAIIDTIMKRPGAAKIGLKEDSAKVLRQMGTDVRKAVQTIHQEAQDDYAKALAELPKGKDMSKQGLKSYLTKTFRKFKVVVDPRKQTLDFSQSTLRKSEERILREIFGVINKWDDMSPEGMNRLGIKIGNYIKGGEQSKALNSIIYGMKKNVRGYLGSRIPEAKAMNASYAKQMDFVEALEQELSIKGAFESEAGLIKTMRKIDKIFGQNKEPVRDLIMRLEKEAGIEVLGKAAGKEIAEVSVTGGIGGLGRGALQTIIPPEAVGSIAIAVGQTKQKVEQTIQRALQHPQLGPVIREMSKLAPAARVALYNLIAQFTGESQKGGGASKIE